MANHLYIRSRWRIAGAAVMLPLAGNAAAQSGIIDVGDARICYEATGSGKPVILIHGWSLNLHAWDDQVKALSTRFRVVTYDRRGFGTSTGRPDVSADPADLGALLDTLGIGKAVLVGHSQGTQTAIRFAAAFPERVLGLVLYGTTPPDGFPVAAPEPPFDRRRIAREHGIDSLVDLVGAGPNSDRAADPAVDARVRAMLATYTARDLLEDYPPSGRYPNPRLEDVRRWDIPTLFIVGDTEAPYIRQVSDSLSRWMPKARMVVIAGGGHGVHFRQPERFNTALREFLSEIPGRP